MGDDYDDTVIVAPHVIDPLATPDFGDTVIPVPPPLPKRKIDHATGEEIAESGSAPTPQPPHPAAVEPMFYAFRLGLGSDLLLLDSPCYVGRRPTPPRITSGIAPQLLQVPSPLKEVSATHVEMRQDGASVVVTDLKTTNGSIVMIPGSVPRTLRPGESVVVSPGTLVDIGDGNILQVLPMQRRIAPAER